MERGTRTLCEGFTLLETAVVVALLAVIIAIATPLITNAMREYRANAAAQEVTDMLYQARTKAVAESKKTSVQIDTSALTIALTTYDASGNAISTNAIPLPDGITFGQPYGVTAPISGAPTTAVVSFPAQSSSVFQQYFNSMGFPTVATPGLVNAIYLTNGRTYRAVTLTCVGSISSWYWTGSAWSKQ